MHLFLMKHISRKRIFPFEYLDASLNRDEKLLHYINTYLPEEKFNKDVTESIQYNTIQYNIVELNRTAFLQRSFRIFKSNSSNTFMLQIKTDSELQKVRRQFYRVSIMKK